MRESDIQDKFDTAKTSLDNSLARIHGTAESGGLKGLADAANKEGLNVKFVEGKNGVGSRIQILGPKGDVIETISDISTATSKLENLVMSQFEKTAISLLGSPDKVIAAMQGERKTIAAERTAQADIEYKGKGGVIDRAYSSGARGGSGKGGASSAENQEKLVTMKAETLMKGQPGRFKDLDQAKAWVVNTAMKGFNAETSWAKMEEDLVKQRVPAAEIVKEKEAFFSRQGFAPASIIDIARTGINPTTNKPFTEKEQQDFYRRYPNTDIEFGAPAPAGTGDAVKPAALPVNPQVSQLQGAINPRSLKDLPLPGRYTPGVTQAAEPTSAEDLKRALYYFKT